MEFYEMITRIVCELRDSHTHIISSDYFNESIKSYPEDISGYSMVLQEFNIKPFINAKESYRYWEKVLSSKEIRLNELSYKVEDNKHLGYRNYHNGDTAYIKFGSFLVSEKGCQFIKKFIHESKNCSNIIIDIRGNLGGSDLHWVENIVLPLLQVEYAVKRVDAFRGGLYGDKYTKMLLNKEDVNFSLPISTLSNSIIPISQLSTCKKCPPELATDFSYLVKGTTIFSFYNPIGFKGDVYVLIDSKVYSAAESFAKFCKDTGFATLVGEKTKGDGGGYPPILVPLPNSGLLLKMRLHMVLNPDGSANAEYGTAPDIEVNEKDALEEILKILEKIE